MKRTLLVLVALTAGGLAAQEKKPEAKVKYPPLPLHVFASKLVKKKWTPPLPEGLTLLDFNGRDVLATVKAKNAVYVETDYLRILSTVPPQKITPETWPRIRETLEILAPVIPQFKKKYPILKGVALAHFFAVHMHRMMVDAWKILGSDLDTYARYLRDYKHGPYMRQKNKFEIYLFGKRNHYLAFSDRFTGRRYTDGLRHRAPVSDVLAFLLPPPPSGPRDLNGWVAVIIHNWAHNVLMSEIKNSYVIPTWLDVGFAHWFERREGEHNTYCFDETGDPPRFASGDWLAKIRTMVLMGRAPELAEFFSKKNLSEFTGDEHGVAFSLVDYLIRERPEGFGPFCTFRRETPGTQRQHFRKAWGESPAMLYEKWRAWVKEAYAKKGRVALREGPRVLR